MATRTAPDFTTAATSRLITLHLMDASGDTFTVSDYFPVGSAAAAIESFANTYQLATQATLYKISDVTVHEGDADPDNADVGQRNSVKDGINLLMKDIAAGKTTTPRIVAPVASIMQGNQDIPLLSALAATNLITSWLILNPSYNLVSAQFTERRERSNNPRVK